MEAVVSATSGSLSRSPNRESPRPLTGTFAFIKPDSENRAIALATSHKSDLRPIGAPADDRIRPEQTVSTPVRDCSFDRAAKTCGRNSGRRSLLSDNLSHARRALGRREVERARRYRSTPDPAVRAMPGRLLLLCSLFRRSWLTVEGGRQVGAARLLHRRGGRAAVAVSVGVAGGVPKQQRRRAPPTCSRVLQIAVRREVAHHE